MYVDNVPICMLIMSQYPNICPNIPIYVDNVPIYVDNVPIYVGNVPIYVGNVPIYVDLMSKIIFSVLIRAWIKWDWDTAAQFLIYTSNKKKITINLK